jgi:hypothetical protein
LARSLRITLLPLPPRSPELNPVENVWQFMRQNWLSNRVFDYYEDIVAHCCEAWTKLTNQPLAHQLFRPPGLGASGSDQCRLVSRIRAEIGGDADPAARRPMPEIAWLDRRGSRHVFGSRARGSEHDDRSSRIATERRHLARKEPKLGGPRRYA